MNDAVPTRTPPELLRVPTPRGLGRTSVLLILAGIAAILAGVVLVCVGFATSSWEFAGAGSLPIAVGVLVCVGARTGQRSRISYRRYLRDLRARGVSALTLEIARRWRRRGAPPKHQMIAAAVNKHAVADGRHAYIVCLGEVEPPEGGELFFEPEIISPTRAIGRQLFFIPIAAAILAFWFLQLLGIIPGRVITLGSFGYLLSMGIVAAGMWVWRTSIRPTYIRMAPGVIQILEYRYGRAKPIIRSYPNEAGTIAILRGRFTQGTPRNLALTLLREDQTDTIDFSRMQGRKHAVERMWQALRSTAPTPPLSNDELVG